MSEERSGRGSLVKWRATSGALLVLLLATIACALHALLDQGIALTHQPDELDRVRRSLALLEALVLRVSPATTRPELFRILHELEIDAFEKPQEGGVHSAELGFYFTEADTLACITADYPPETSRCARFARPGA
jgi:hypothetical protein